MRTGKPSKLKFREILLEAARLNPALWKGDGDLSINGVAKFFQSRGFKVSQPNLDRMFKGTLPVNEDLINAMYNCFGVPKSLLRGEQGDDMDKLLTEYRLSTLLVAKKLEDLPRTKYENIVNLINDAHEEMLRIRELTEQGKVTHITRNRQ